MSEKQTLTWERIDGFPLNCNSQNPAYGPLPKLTAAVIEVVADDNTG